MVIPGLETPSSGQIVVALSFQVILSISSCNKTFEFTNKSFEAYTLKDTGKL